MPESETVDTKDQGAPSTVEAAVEAQGRPEEKVKAPEPDYARLLQEAQERNAQLQAELEKLQGQSRSQEIALLKQKERDRLLQEQHELTKLLAQHLITQDPEGDLAKRWAETQRRLGQQMQGQDIAEAHQSAYDEIMSLAKEVGIEDPNTDPRLETARLYFNEALRSNNIQYFERAVIEAHRAARRINASSAKAGKPSPAKQIPNPQNAKAQANPQNTERPVSTAEIDLGTGLPSSAAIVSDEARLNKLADPTYSWTPDDLKWYMEYRSKVGIK